MSTPLQKTWQSADGLTLSATVHPGDPTSLPVVCLPGLTRNSRDFEDLAASIAPFAPVICPDLRGRGRSDHAADPMTYNPAQYCADLAPLLAELTDGFLAIGTSLGGLLTMMIAASGAKLVGAVLNDIGPVIDPAGLARIRGYVGKALAFPDWDSAARALALAQADAFPHFVHADWLRMARRTMRETDGSIAFDYDMAIATPFASDDGASPAPDLWPLFDALKPVPLLVVRGGTSDILSAQTADAMIARHGNARLLTVPGVGHAPTLDEPDVRAAIRALVEATT